MIFPLRIAASRSAYSNLVCQRNFFDKAEMSALRFSVIHLRAGLTGETQRLFRFWTLRGELYAYTKLCLYSGRHPFDSQAFISVVQHWWGSRIGFLASSASTYLARHFRQRLRAWLCRRDIVIALICRVERLPELGVQAVRLKVDVIVTVSSAVLAAKKASATIPIVFCSLPIQEEVGLFPSLARPGGNITT